MLYLFCINLIINVAHPVFLMHIQSLLSGYAPGADPAENQTPSYSAEVELEGNEVNPWPYSCSIMQC